MKARFSRQFKPLNLNIGPYMILGISIATAIGLLIVFYYVVLWGVVIGGILWLIMLIKYYLSKNTDLEQKPKGRTINHDRIQ